jgi:hypothetical protein
MNFRYKLERLRPGMLFQPSLMFVGKAVAYPSEASFRCSTLGHSTIRLKIKKGHVL